METQLAADKQQQTSASTSRGSNSELLVEAVSVEPQSDDQHLLDQQEIQSSNLIRDDQHESLESVGSFSDTCKSAAGNIQRVQNGEKNLNGASLHTASGGSLKSDMLQIGESARQTHHEVEHEPNLEVSKWPGKARGEAKFQDCSVCRHLLSEARESPNSMDPCRGSVTNEAGQPDDSLWANIEPTDQSEGEYNYQLVDKQLTRTEQWSAELRSTLRRPSSAPQVSSSREVSPDRSADLQADTCTGESSRKEVAEPELSLMKTQTRRCCREIMRGLSLDNEAQKQMRVFKSINKDDKRHGSSQSSKCLANKLIIVDKNNISYLIKGKFSLVRLRVARRRQWAPRWSCPCKLHVVVILMLPNSLLALRV